MPTPGSTVKMTRFLLDEGWPAGRTISFTAWYDGHDGPCEAEINGRRVGCTAITEERVVASYQIPPVHEGS